MLCIILAAVGETLPCLHILAKSMPPLVHRDRQHSDGAEHFIIHFASVSAQGTQGTLSLSISAFLQSDSRPGYRLLSVLQPINNSDINKPHSRDLTFQTLNLRPPTLPTNTKIFKYFRQREKTFLVC